MRSFGGTPLCPRCERPVYAAEQVMGPGRKLYHRPCLACTICNKRLDSLLLLEHDQQPYCRSCHVKNFGTRDLRQANLLNRHNGPPPIGTTAHDYHQPNYPEYRSSPAPQLVSRPVREVNLLDSSSPHPLYQDKWDPNEDGEMLDEFVILPQIPTPSACPPPMRSAHISEASTNVVRELGSFSVEEFTLSGNGARNRNGSEDPRHSHSHSLDTTFKRASDPDRFNSSITSSVNKTHSPLIPTSTGTLMGIGAGTGTRYGVALTGQTTGSSLRNWGGVTPSCGRCGKSVYFAEQVKAIGKTYHKGCLRCRECNTLLDSTRLTEKDGEPLCHRCYSKLHGPQGSGYALLGKAGG